MATILPPSSCWASYSPSFTNVVAGPRRCCCFFSPVGQTRFCSSDTVVGMCCSVSHSFHTSLLVNLQWSSWLHVLFFMSNSVPGSGFRRSHHGGVTRIGNPVRFCRDVVWYSSDFHIVVADCQSLTTTWTPTKYFPIGAAVQQHHWTSWTVSRQCRTVVWKVNLA